MSSVATKLLGLSILLVAASTLSQSGYVIDPKAGSVAGITVGMTEAAIRNSGKPYEVRTKIAEGDEYKVYELRLADHVRLECTLDLDNKVYSLDSTSVEIRDQHGLGVGSQLRALKQAYPAGKFIQGIAEGRFAAFDTGARLIFRFDHRDFADACFERPAECKVDDDVVVRSISIS